MKNWFRRRWYDFRTGHNTYLVFFLSLTNFLLIAYNFLVLQVPILASLFPNILIFGVFSLMVYIPLAMYIGYWHRKNQLNTDLVLQAEQNPIYIELKRDIEEIKEMLNQ